jgi:uncharacterized membrane protein
MKLTKVEATVEINKPVNEVFAYASDWRHWNEWREGLYNLKPTTNIERGNGARYYYKAWAAGMKINLESETHLFKENVGWQSIVQKGLPHKMQWVFENRSGKTIVTNILEYSPPWFLIGPILNFFILRRGWQRILNNTLNNLKNHFEGSSEIKEQHI